ncbi:MAG: tetratricopeptide repeat protein [Bacteroidales bacterium]|nr:tetratricopeptide repeat protein [Bacteroidales bacterium]
MRPTFIKILLFLFALLQTATAIGQQSEFYHDPDQDLKEGLTLYGKSQFGAAQDRFDRYLHRTEGAEATSRMDAAFYLSMCALELDQRNGEALVRKFLEEYPESSKAQLARFKMGNFLFREKKFRRALRWYQQIVLQKLNKELLQEYRFKTGYCYFKENKPQRAAKLFLPLLQADGPFRDDATYYYSYLSYLKGDFNQALDGFTKLTASKKYDGVVPYYLAQIYYQREQYNQVIETGVRLIRKANPGQQNELSRIIGESYFRLNRFAEAIPYLEQYRKGVRSLSREEYYTLGYCYYTEGADKQAAQILEKVSDKDDALTQYTSHLLGGILVRMGDKYKARSAFQRAAKLQWNKKIQEESLFNYAKLNFELSISGETLRSFESFLTTFPNSAYTDQVYDYLVKVFMNTRNYKDALVTLDKIRNKTPEVEKAYQRIAYYRGLELYNNLKYRESVDLFDRSLTYSRYQKDISALCYYWSAEAWYNLKRYPDATEAYRHFISIPGASSLKEYKLAYYGLGYCYFSRAQYNQALQWFKRFISQISRKQDRLMADSYNRIGDCYYMTRTYWQAINSYEKATSMRTRDADYSLYQKGFCYGLVQRPNQKINVLNELITSYPKSNYVDDALFEIGRTYVGLEETPDAVRTFNNLIEKYPQSSYARKSYVQLGLIYYGKDQYNEALDRYKTVISKWPDTQEAHDALIGIKNIYVDQNRVDEYFAYLKSTGTGKSVSATEQDSLTYMAAENLYMGGDCARAAKLFRQYIDRFPQGSFILNAQYYKADCDFRASRLDNALASYEFILSKGVTDFTELALDRSAQIYYERTQYPEAKRLYEQLEKIAEVPAHQLDARLGIMRCAYEVGDYPLVISKANEVLLTDKIGDEVIREASYKMGKAYLETGDVSNALDIFSVVAQDVRNVEGAEAKYLKAELLFKSGKTDQAEKEVLDFIDQNTTHQFWLAKAYILWSDIYLKRGDLFQAKATLQILKENYKKTNDGILKAVDEKLNWIKQQNQ